MKPTPAHEQHNPDLLAFLPANCRSLVEVGCSTGALAREYKKLNPACRYLGIDIDAGSAERARRYCDEVFVENIEAASAACRSACRGADCWVFGDALEHLVDPWAVLSGVRQVLPTDGCVVACVPNAQHWSIQARLSCGEFRYEDAGLLDRTHLRWFTRSTLIEMFQSSGFRITEGRPRVFAEPQRERVLEVIRTMAEVCGGDPAQAVADALPTQFVIKAVPV